MQALARACRGVVDELTQAKLLLETEKNLRIVTETRLTLEQERAALLTKANDLLTAQMQAVRAEATAEKSRADSLLALNKVQADRIDQLNKDVEKWKGRTKKAGLFGAIAGAAAVIVVAGQSGR